MEKEMTWFHWAGFAVAVLISIYITFCEIRARRRRRFRKEIQELRRDLDAFRTKFEKDMTKMRPRAKDIQ